MSFLGLPLCWIQLKLACLAVLGCITSGTEQDAKGWCMDLEEQPVRIQE